MSRFKHLIKPILFVVVLLLLLESASYVLMHTEGGNDKQARQILREPAHTLDYLVLGDSESYSSLSPMEIWREYGYAGYNCGVPGQRLQDTFYFLQEVLERQSPKVILLETNLLFRSSDSQEEFQKTAGSVIQQFFPIYKYHDRWKYMTLDTLLFGWRNPKRNEPDTLKGFRYNITIAPYTKGDYVKRTDQVEPIQEIPLRYLNRLADLCDEQGIQLILYSSPSPSCWSYAKHNGVAAYAADRALPYVDLNLHLEGLGIDWSKDTRDKGDHVNYYGARKVTAYLGAYLEQNGGLTDHRQDAGYASWADLLAKYENMTQTAEKIT